MGGRWRRAALFGQGCEILLKLYADQLHVHDEGLGHFGFQLSVPLFTFLAPNFLRRGLDPFLTEGFR